MPTVTQMVKRDVGEQAGHRPELLELPPDGDTVANIYEMARLGRSATQRSSRCKEAL